MNSRKQWKTIKQICIQVGMMAWMAVVVLWWIAYACGIRSYIVMSGSMEPKLQTGSVCFVDTRFPYEEIQRGDVIAFRHGSGMVTHRVVAVTEEGLETKGDANDLSDGITTTDDNFHGKTVLSIPYVGYALHVLRQPLSLWIAGIVLIGCILWQRLDRIGS